MSKVETPPFAREFPEDPDLALLVRAFQEGNYAHVRAEAPKLVAKTEDAKVKEAAQTLVSHTEADPLAKRMLLLTLALMMGLFFYWMAHDGPDPNAPKASPAKPPVVESPNSPVPLPSPKPAGS